MTVDQHLPAALPALPLLRSLVCVYLPVSDKKRAQAWYIEKGLLRKGSHDPELADGRCVFLLETRSGKTANFPTRDWGEGSSDYEMFSITFEVEDIDAAHAHMVAGGIEADPIQDNGGCEKGFTFFDPDGNRLCVWQPPRSSPAPLA
jgi:catechol 2,3-dioxygenase-like lactoylglutathione lyase family enzyme